jgi:putative MATE family efflux protein
MSDSSQKHPAASDSTPNSKQSSAPKLAMDPALNKSSSPSATFVSGSTMRHVLVMTGTGSVGLVSIFIVDLLNLLYISQLGKPELTAAVGYASSVAWFFISFGIGLSIATSAIVSRIVGSGDRKRAGVSASAALVLVAAVTSIICLFAAPFLSALFTFLGATGDTHRYALRFMLIQLPAIPLLALGMSLGGLLRSVGDPKRAMWLTLLPAFMLAILDPLFIFWLGLELDGAAIVLVLARIAMVVIGLFALMKFHKLLSKPTLEACKNLYKPFFAIGLPATLTQIASPIANAMVTSAMAGYGDQAVSGWAVIGRLMPMAFGVIFALSGSIGPIIGQNYGAKRFDRVRSVIKDSLKVTVIYCTLMCIILAILSSFIANSFDAQGVGREIVIFFCVFAASSFIFQGMMFVSNAAFNTLGYQMVSTALNWGRATLGVLPFVWLGGHWYGAKGVVAGYSLGGVLFGLISLWICTKVLRNIEAREIEANKHEANKHEANKHESNKNGVAVAKS